jgi:hypothetical protein
MSLNKQLQPFSGIDSGFNQQSVQCLRTTPYKKHPQTQRKERFTVGYVCEQIRLKQR